MNPRRNLWRISWGKTWIKSSRIFWGKVYSKIFKKLPGSIPREYILINSLKNPWEISKNYIKRKCWRNFWRMKEFLEKIQKKHLFEFWVWEPLDIFLHDSRKVIMREVKSNSCSIFCVNPCKKNPGHFPAGIFNGNPNAIGEQISCGLIDEIPIRNSKEIFNRFSEEIT